MSDVTVALPAEATRARYALGVLLSLLGATARDAAPGSEADIVYGDGAGRVRIPAGPQQRWDEELPAVAHSDGVPALRLGPMDPAHGRPGFDLLYATYASLAAPWERTDPADEVGCPLARGGFLDRHGLLMEPLVHRYAQLLGRALGRSLKGEPRLVLTHDVDDNFRHLFERRVSLELLRRDLAAHRPAAVRRAAGLLRRVAVPSRQDPNDRFDEWQGWHRGWGSRAAYFVASAGVLAPGSARQDVPYDVGHPTVRKTLRHAVDGGAEVGIHFSIHARESAARLRAEREALEEAAGVRVRSARHHWWALGQPPTPTWRAHAEAGIELDCSLGFNDAPGFRRGICVPFRPFDDATEEPMPLHVLPTIAMDASLPRGLIVEQLGSLEQAVREARGALVLDWHVHAANPQWLPRVADGLRAFVADARRRGLEPRTPLELLAERR